MLLEHKCELIGRELQQQLEQRWSSSIRAAGASRSGTADRQCHCSRPARLAPAVACL